MWCRYAAQPMSNRRNVVLGAAAVVAVVMAVRAQREARRLEQRLADEREIWSQQRAALERAPGPFLPPPPQRPTPCAVPSAREIIAGLRALPAGAAPRTLRLAVHGLEELIRIGPAALPAIQDFLATQVDRDMDVGWLERGHGWRDTLPGDFVAPPSLRLGLFDVARRIGGPPAEDLLGVALSVTERGLELAFLTRLLHEMAPGRYREVALTAARQLLASAARPPGASPLDVNHRAHLYTVLAFYGDGSFAAQAEAQLVTPGGVDRAALQYLGRTLGPRAVSVAARAYQDPRLADPGRREPLARMALAYVGADQGATELWQRTIDDPATPRGQRQNLIEDLNETGFPDPRNLGPRDLPLIEARLALIEKLAPLATDPANAGAFKEAYKDLQEMRRRVLGTGSPPR